ncbi:NTP transferase domain-containing protein [Candidatus Saganbacteria bacterium]|nr:NTP transferase domain-containing protein [Candidatus Saganbacteria bacterium]
MKIIIPMAGHSRRFKAAGYDDPKPFIMIDGKMMIEYVCQMFSPNDEFIFVCNEEQLKNERHYAKLKTIAPHGRVIGIPAHEQGPVYSALAADAYVKADEEVIISYCDFFVLWNYKAFLMKAQNYDGGIPVFRGFHPASYGDTNYCYLRGNERGELLELWEKRSFSDNRVQEHASAGIYYFDRWSTYKHYANLIIKGEEKVAGEYYVSLVFNPMVRDGKKVCLHEVDKFICWGTPEDLEQYLFWSGYFKDHANRIMKYEVNNA